MSERAAALAAEPVTTWQLPFGFARRHGVVVLTDNDTLRLLCLASVTPQTLVEVQRVLGADIAPEWVSDADFEQHLTRLYQRDSADAQQLMADIGADADSDDFFLAGRGAAAK